MKNGNQKNEPRGHDNNQERLCLLAEAPLLIAARKDEVVVSVNVKSASGAYRDEGVAC